MATAENALAVEQCRQELAERAAATGENALAAEQRRRESAKRAAETAEKALAMDQRRQESAECAAAMAEKALAKEQRPSSLAKMALAEYDAQTIASWDAAAVEVVDHITTLGVMLLTDLKTAPKLRYGGPPPNHFSPPLTAKEVAELDAATLNKRCHHEMAAREKALADEANEQRRPATQEKALADEAYERCRAATQEKALADEVNKQRRQVTAMQENALADDAFEQRYQESAKCAAASAELALAAERAAVLTDLTLPPTAMSPPPHTLLCIRTRSSLPWGGAFTRSLSLLHHCLARQLRLMANSRRHVATANLVAVLAAAMAPGLPIHRSNFFVGGNIGPALPTNLL